MILIYFTFFYIFSWHNMPGNIWNIWNILCFRYFRFFSNIIPLHLFQTTSCQCSNGMTIRCTNELWIWRIKIQNWKYLWPSEGGITKMEPQVRPLYNVGLEIFSSIFQRENLQKIITDNNTWAVMHNMRFLMYWIYFCLWWPRYFLLIFPLEYVLEVWVTTRKDQ